MWHAAQMMKGFIGMLPMPRSGKLYKKKLEEVSLRHGLVFYRCR